jgi:molybdenum cofactor synthesis domain-containing protein
MKPPRKSENELILGLVSVSDRASRGIYDDKGIPTLEAWCRKAITNPLAVHRRLIPDDRFEIEKTLRELVDIIGCDLVLTTGGTGPSRRDVTPEATLAVATREMPGFGEQMRAISGHFVPTAILSRQVGVLRETPDHAALIINLPGQPKAIGETLEGLKDADGRQLVNGIFAAVPYCIDLIGGPYIETNEEVVKAFRPKSARRPKPEETAGASAAPAEEKAAEPAPAPSAEKPAEAPSEPAREIPIEAPEPRPETIETRAEETPAPAAPQESAPRPDPRPLAAPFHPSEILTVVPRMAQSEPVATVVWLHGMGVDNRDFAPFPDEILDFGGPVLRFVMPNAPVREIMQHPGYNARMWFSHETDSIEEGVEIASIRESQSKIEQLIDAIEERGVPRSRIFLGGFSQGAAMALYAGLRAEKPLGGVIALSGYLPLPGTLFSEITPVGRTMPVFMAHGAFDSVISPIIAERCARIVGEVDSAFEWHSYDIDHELAPEEMQALTSFLERNI